nr:hypothetical protein [Tanacetum cinerariifolium]
MIPEPGDPNREVPVNETFHVQTDDELTEKELKQIEADDQTIQTILLGLPEDIYATVDSCQMMKGSDIGIQEKNAKLFNEWERFTSTNGESIEPYYHRFLKLMNDLKQNKHFLEKIARNLNGYNDVQNVRNQVIQNAVQNPRIQNVGNQNGLIVVSRNANQNSNGNGNLLTARAEGNATRHNGNQIRNQVIQNAVQNPRIHNVGNQNGLIVVMGNANQNPNRNGNLVAAHVEVRPRRRDAAYLQTQLLIVKNKKARIQLQAEEFDLMAAAADLDEIEEVNANCILMANLQQATTSGTQTHKAPVYDSDGLAEVHNYEDCYDNEIFNMFTQEEQYTELLEPIPESHQVPQNDNNVIFEVSSVKQSGGTVEQHPANVKETLVLHDLLYNNLAIEVEKVNMVNRKLSETNAELTTELARYKNQEKCFEISQEKYDKLERCSQKSVYQEQCLSKK